MTRNTQPAPGQPQPAPPSLSRRARIAITLFVAFNLFAIIAWCVPLDSPLVMRSRELVRPYMVFTGLFQKWDMFAPDPSRLNNFVGATITYRNGGSSMWFFPRMENLGFVDKYFKERYRKYANDNLRLDSNSDLWPDAARYIARLNNRPSNPPDVVALVRYWSIVPPPGPQGEEPPETWNQHMFYLYRVTPGDLK
ncbi:MAG TPA: hypothetical protein VGH38_32165 [Bryobacteraceae bacterium]|jgi:hypothetical protein